jgi:predicted RNA-binding Zn-ribbon protein involved in translation (DUF1610 family)
MTPIYGTWNNPADRRCNFKAAYPNMAIAEKRACKATAKAGHLIIAYQCFDCGSFHIGRADESQNIVRQQEVKTESLPRCTLCGEIMHVRTNVFNPNPDGPVCGTKRCKRRRQRRRQAERRRQSIS